MLRRSGRGLVIVLVGELWASGSPGQPIERRKRRDSRLSAGNAGTADRAPGLPGQPLERQKLSSTSAGACVGVPVALQEFLWGVFIYNPARLSIGYCFERDLLFALPKKN